MSAQFVPLTNSPNQSFLTTLEVDGNPLTLQLAIRYSEIAGYWLMSVSNASGSLLVDSVPLITGYYPAANLLGQQAYLAIGSAFLINASGVSQDYPDWSNLGSDFVLLWDDTPTV